MYILDTNIVRYYLTQPQNYPHLVARIRAANNARALAITVVTAQELVMWRATEVNNRPDANVLAVINQYNNLFEMLEDMKRYLVLPFNNLASERFQGLAGLQTQIGTRDRRIAAVALAHNLPVVTLNLQHFNLVPGLRVLDWCTP